MIVEWFVSFMLGLVANIVGLIPSPDGVAENIATGVSWMMAFDSLAPLSEMLAGALVLMGVQSTMFFLKLTQVLISHIPLVGGSGG